MTYAQWNRVQCIEVHVAVSVQFQLMMKVQEEAVRNRSCSGCDVERAGGGGEGAGDAQGAVLLCTRRRLRRITPCTSI
jgi:hypothetical protein